ncbi:hypothetical protein [Oceanobacillus iheyensis HTE831]|uniref:Uncharacterized protein n=1 Tax=Oceanobacillus iheyensis (strain DSM 14371 / CIP 107618 / JCM 11309 / KCTC 3954 / HTE831) TaxID=221109 RepID=Q8ENQ6_OCEIH|nr:hypothetical protein [Oceanobacillus iheyensis HTE831]
MKVDDYLHAFLLYSSIKTVDMSMILLLYKAKMLKRNNQDEIYLK